MAGHDLSLAMIAVLVAAVVAIPLWLLRQMEQQTRGMFGRPYAAVVDDLLAEGRRRAELLARLVNARDARIARLERRAESDR